MKTGKKRRAEMVTEALKQTEGPKRKMLHGIKVKLRRR